LIHFENVGLRYGMGPEILRDLTFDIPKKSFQFLTGPSGAGKTTLLRLLFLSLQPTRGLIRMFGRDISDIPRPELPLLRRRVGIVFQDFRLLDHLTTYENVALPLRVRGKDESSYKTDVLELLKWVGLGERINVSTGLRYCLPTSRPATSIRRWHAACSICFSNSIASAPPS
jgi:cell division transport system ATP-binding protein